MKTEVFLDVLKAVKPALANKEILDQSTNFVFKDGRVYTFDDAIMISHPIKVKLKGALPSKELYDLLSRIKSESVTIKQKEREVSISGDNFSAGIVIEKKIALPIKTLKITEKWHKLPGNFCEALQFGLFSVSKNYSKPIFTYINVCNDSLYSSDTFRATQYTMSNKIKGSLLIPLTAATKLLNYNPTHYQVGKNWTHCKNIDGVVFSFRNATLKYPDVTSLLQQEGPLTNIKFPSKLSAALTNAEVFCKEETDKTRLVDITIDGDSLELHGKGDIGWYKEKFKLKKKHPKLIKFDINASSFKDILAHLKKAELSGDKKTIGFKGANFIHIICLV